LTAKKEKRYPVKNAEVLLYDAKIKLFVMTSTSRMIKTSTKYLELKEKSFLEERRAVSIPINAPIYIPVHLEQTKKYELFTEKLFANC